MSSVVGANHETSRLDSLERIAFDNTSISQFPVSINMYESLKILIFLLLVYHEERAILHGRSGHHKQALFIYVILLHNLEMAEAYCKEKYNADKANDCDVSTFCFPGQHFQ